jgi:DNA repair exonuclease SbcCD ATPase subunit
MMELTMDEAETLKTKLDDLDRRIREARDHLKLREVFHKDHEATADELARRYKMLRDNLNSEVSSLEAQGKHVNSFQKTVLDWLNKIGFDR